jgi:hypothetical protein
MEIILNLIVYLEEYSDTISLSRGSVTKRLR